MRVSVRQIGLLALSAALALVLAAPARAAFPADNGLIAYQKQVARGYQVFSSFPDGSGATRITSGGQTFSPSFSPDGRQLAVFRLAGSTSGVWIFDVHSGTWVRRVAAFPADFSDTTAPDWSPDGQKIVYTRNHKLWVVNADGTGARPVSPEGSPDASRPAWSPDGTRIAFRGWNAEVKRFQIYTVTPAGTGLMRLTTSETSDPDWSPDATRIAYTRYRGSNSDVWVMDADGSNGAAVTSTGRGKREIHPAWSPRGDRIAFYDQATGWLSTIDPGGAGIARVDEMPQGAGGLSWQPELRDPLSVTLNYSTMTDVIRANGQIGPSHAGQPVVVELSVSRDRWTRVASKRLTLSAKSRYVVRFARRTQLLCRLTTIFLGDVDHRPTSTSKIFSC